jgi:hypothetical protein
MKSVPIERLVIQPPFSDSFAIDPEVLSRITASMQEMGYDPAFPIATWDLTVIDGHTRLEAAKAAGLRNVWIEPKAFADEDEAYLYAVRTQVQRRNLAPRELLVAFQRVDRIKGRGRPSGRPNFAPKELPSFDGTYYGDGRAAESVDATAAELHLSASIASRLRAIAKDKQATAELLAGGKISGVYTNLRNRIREGRNLPPHKPSHGRKPLPPSPPPLTPERIRSIQKIAETWRMPTPPEKLAPFLAAYYTRDQMVALIRELEGQLGDWPEGQEWGPLVGTAP